MTRILILGGGGMIGQKLAHHLAADGWQGQPAEVILHDVGFAPDGAVAAQRMTGSLTEPGAVERLAALRPDVIFHLAAIVSGEAEQDFDKGWDVNMFPTWHLLSALRAEHVNSGETYLPRLVFSSSIAVFGAPFPDKIGDDFLAAPLTSYGAQKACCELMIGDFSRKGFINGVSIRLPTICVRPGKPNKAASGFFSGIIREPLNGLDAVLPVPDTVRHLHASPRSAVGFLMRAGTMELDPLGARRSLNMPGVSCTIAEQIEALRAVAGADAVAHIRSDPDENITKIVAGWPRDFDTARARELGFVAESDFAEIIRTYIADEMTPA
ncbi:D-erythronate dehydrogenase [Sedimentitalea todarodis]|uniref:SDR family oxidoreductase n=1 Tax=Sedimentitalea todarodis TaxID=1631240 RepID=A0ABU3VHH7_9RHOB|nr:D-erythronate dehydrogenase [Sedimentitalea todarodis]MDU9005646.1 SDR family oxidoreductase [Sedimentitalea todarodis]